MRVQRKYTIKEWKRLFQIQEKLCKKYDVILVDHKTKKEQLINVLKKINLENINKGIDTFNQSIQDFGDSMDKLTTELDNSPRNNIKIWSDLPKNEPKTKTKDQINLEKIWGDKFEM